LQKNVIKMSNWLNWITSIFCKCPEVPFCMTLAIWLMSCKMGA
jgi:hypothetical protein